MFATCFWPVAESNALNRFDTQTSTQKKELSTHNAVERLAICDEFGLTELREKILEQLTANKKALAEVTIRVGQNFSKRRNVT